MICEKCGAVLPDDATFCGECGAKIEKKSEKAKKTSAALKKAKAEAKRYKIISVVLAALCVILFICWMVSSHDPYNNLDNYEKQAVNVERGGVELSGTYVVGEDSELPAGRYNIYPPDGESYMSVDIYDNMENAKKRYDKDYNSLAIDDIYSMTRGYKLKAGQIVVIEYDSAYFELVEEEVTETSEPETTATESAAPAEDAAAEPSGETQ